MNLKRNDPVFVLGDAAGVFAFQDGAKKVPGESVPQDLPQRLEARTRNVARWCGVLVGATGAWVVASRWLLIPALTAWTANFSPESPRAGVAWFALGVATYFVNASRPTPGRRRGVFLSLICVLILCLWSILEAWGVPRFALAALGLPPPGHFSIAPAQGVSFPTAVSLLLAFVGLLAWARTTKGRLAGWAGIIGLGLVSVNFVFLIGFIHGSSLVLNRDLSPVSFFSAAAGFLAGVALVATAGPESIPLRWFMGRGIRAKLLWTFLPLTALVSFAGELFHDFDFGYSLSNPAWHSIPATALVMLAILWAVRLTARDLERTEAARQQAEAALRESRDQLDVRVQERTAELARVNETLRREIAERREIEEGLQLFADAVESTHELISITDQANRFTFVNRAFLQTYGFAPQEILGRTPECLDSPKNSPSIRAEILQHTLRGGWRGELINLRKDGSEFPILLVTAQIKNAGGKTLGLIGVARDMSEPRRAEKQATAFSLLAHRLSAATLPEQAGTIIMDIAWELFECDAGYFQLYAATGEDLVPVLALDTINGIRLKIPPANIPPEPGPIVTRVLKEGGQLINRADANEFSAELHPFGDTSRKSASLMFVPIHGEGPVLGILSVQSYTLRKYREADLLLLQALADHCGHALQRIKVAEALRVAETNYQRIFEQAMDGIFQAVPEGRFARVNPAYARMFGYPSPAAMIATGTFGRDTHVSPERWAELLRLMAQTDAIQGFEAECYRQDGSRFWLNMNGRVLRDDRGGVVAFEGIAQDITNRNRMENDLRASEARFRQVVEHIREVFWMTDPTKQQMLYVSPGYEEMWGRTRQSLYDDALGWLEAVHAEDRDRVRDAAFTEQVRGTYHEIYRIVRPDGSIRWIEDRAFPLANEHGEIYRIVGLAEDVTARAEAAEVLRESEARFRTLFEAAPIGIALHGPDGRYVSVNRAYCDMLGYTEAQLRKLGTKRITHPLDVADGKRLYAELVAGKRDHYEREKRYLTRDGREVHAFSAASAVRHRNGALRYIISMVVDITERKRLRDELLEISTQERRRFGNDLHDGLGQQLTAISFKAKCLEDVLDTEAPANLAAARELVGLINGAIGQTRALARGLDPVEVELGGLVSALENLVLETGNRFAVVCHFHCDQPAIPLKTVTALHLFRIAQEALNNAVKHSGAREIMVELALRNGALRLTILDDGHGFPADSPDLGGLGLRSMKYRADSIGATLKIRPRSIRGVAVECVLPNGVLSQEQLLQRHPS